MALLEAVAILPQVAAVPENKISIGQSPVAMRREVVSVPALIAKRTVDSSSSPSPAPQRQQPNLRSVALAREARNFAVLESEPTPAERMMLRAGEIAENAAIQSKTLGGSKRR